MKFEIELEDEHDQLQDLKLDDEDKAAIELEQIGIGHSAHKDHTLFGGSNLNHQLAQKMARDAQLRAQMTEAQIEAEKKKSYRAMNFDLPRMHRLQRQNRQILEVDMTKQ